MVHTVTFLKHPTAIHNTMFLKHTTAVSWYLKVVHTTKFLGIASESIYFVLDFEFFLALKI